MERFALLSGHNDDIAVWKELSEQTPKAFIDKFYNKEGGFFGNNTVTANILPLRLGMLDGNDMQTTRKRVFDNIVRKTTVDFNSHISTGLIGIQQLMRGLTDYGRGDLALRIATNTTYPSWGYTVERGATTIWERLNSYTLKDGFGGNNRMNSFNHYSFGAVGSWLINHSLGIKRDERATGFQRFTLQPEPDPTGKLTSAHGYYDSVYGRIESGWTRKEGGTEYRFTIPANTSATLLLPASSSKRITEGGRRLKRGSFSVQKSLFHNTIRLVLPSGTYCFAVKE